MLTYTKHKNILMTFFLNRNQTIVFMSGFRKNYYILSTKDKESLLVGRNHSTFLYTYSNEQSQSSLFNLSKTLSRNEDLMHTFYNNRRLYKNYYKLRCKI